MNKTLKNALKELADCQVHRSHARRTSFPVLTPGHELIWVQVDDYTGHVTWNSPWGYMSGQIKDKYFFIPQDKSMYVWVEKYRRWAVAPRKNGSYVRNGTRVYPNQTPYRVTP